MPEVRLNARKWATRSAAAGGDYDSGVRNPRRSQSAAAIASEPNYEAGINEAIGRKAYSKGLQKSGDAKWMKGATEKGRARFQQGVSVSETEYQAGFEPFASALRSVTLQPRGPKGQNYGRVQQVGDALRQAKLSR